MSSSVVIGILRKQYLPVIKKAEQEQEEQQTNDYKTN